jgi:hypothetical protein
MGDITFNDTAIDEVDDDVYFNGTALALYKGVYFNGTRVWTKHPYEPGTVIFTYRWDDWYSQGNPVSGHTMQASGTAFTIANFVNDYPTLYPEVFDGTPYFTGGSGGSNSTIRFTLNPGFTVSYYRQSALGIDSDGDGTNTGGSYNLWRGNTVSGLGSIDYGLAYSGSGNNWSEFKVSYLGRED